MNKIELVISDISPSGSTSGAYALVLSELKGTRKLPIVIGGHEAQAIAIEMEKMTPSRPLTHDLFKTFAQSFQIEVEEVIIYNLIEGIFFSKVIAVKDGQKVEIDARTSDAVALAVRFDCPINCYDFIMESAGVNAEEAKSAFTESDPDLDVEEITTSSKPTSMSLAELQEELEKAIDREDYENASRLRDEIQKRTS